MISSPHRSRQRAIATRPLTTPSRRVEPATHHGPSVSPRWPSGAGSHAAIDNIYPSILVVRDLASGYQLLALPTIDQSAKTACDAILPLFRQFDPPLVLKSDNGSFRAAEFTQLLDQCRVCPLFSPPQTPSYNGAAEAGIGSIKTRAHHIAAAHGRPGQWTCDDVEAARLLANATARPWGTNAPTPQAAWNHRQRITPQERNRFWHTLRSFQAKLDASCPCSENHTASTQTHPSCVQYSAAGTGRSDPRPRQAKQRPSATNDPCQHQTPCSTQHPTPIASHLDDPTNRPGPDAPLWRRIAIRRALVARGLLTLSKPRRITPAISQPNVQRIT